LDIETKATVVLYYSTKVSFDQIEKSVTSVGYDNEKYKGDGAAYKNLSDCRRYERK